MFHVLRDARFGLRMMARRPGLTTLAILALALGIGAVAAQFSVINGAMLRGLPFRNPEEIVSMRRWNVDRQPWDTDFPVHDFNDIVARQQSCVGLAGWYGGTVNLVVDSVPIRLQGPRISHTFLDLIGVQPILGRGFLPEEDKPDVPPVIILGYGVWQKHFNGDRGVLERPVRINGRPGRVVGVMPKGFLFPVREEVWIPLQSAYNWSEIQRGQGYSLNVMGRLKPGITREAATAEMTGLVQQLADAYPDSNKRYREAEVLPFVDTFIDENMRSTLYVMLAAGVAILLIACANVANLLLVSFSQRIKELAIRSSLGASRVRLVVQILTEALILAVVGAFGGVTIAVGALRLLTGYAETMQMPFWFDFSLDPRVLAVVALATVLTGLLSGIVPALRASRANMNDILKDDNRTGTSLHLGWLSRILVMAQVALSCVLLVLSGLMVRSIQKIRTTDYGFDTSSVVTARMGLFEGDYPKSEDRHAFWMRLRRALEARPEVGAVALYNRYRWNTMMGWGRLAREGRTYATFDDHPLVNYESVTPGYFATLGVRILAGRDFDETDEAAATNIIVNQKLAAELFPNEDPIGQRLQRQPWPQERGPDGKPPVHEWMTIVGVVPAMQSEGAGNTIKEVAGRAYYTMLDPKETPTFMTVVVRARVGDAKSALPAVREEVAKLDPNLPLYAVGTPAELIAEDTAQIRIITNIFKIFGVVAVFLAAIGIYGVVSFSVNQRWQEFGIRSALGATSPTLLMMILRSNAIQLAIGLICGVPAAWILSYLMRATFYGVSPNDVATYAIVIVALGTVASSACLVPALRAARVHPAQALRQS